MNAICNDCKQEMKAGVGCTFKFFIDAQGTYWKRIKNSECICHDCNAGIGKYHHDGCDWERCPKCGDQAMCCDCGFVQIANRKIGA